jgi:hypothetical protein
MLSVILLSVMAHDFLDMIFVSQALGWRSLLKSVRRVLHVLICCCGLKLVRLQIAQVESLIGLTPN